jgi:ATP-dependent Lon protease
MTELPLIALRDGPLFPGIPVELPLGRTVSIAAAQSALTNSKRAVVVAQRDPYADEPTIDGYFAVGCIAELTLVKRIPDALLVSARGLQRGRIATVISAGDHHRAVVTSLDFATEPREPLDARRAAILRGVVTKMDGNPDAPTGELVDHIVMHLTLDAAEAQWFLETDDVAARVKRALDDRSQLAFEDARAVEAREERGWAFRFLFGKKR